MAGYRLGDQSSIPGKGGIFLLATGSDRLWGQQNNIFNYVNADH
jgi:hypothetical protein